VDGGELMGAARRKKLSKAKQSVKATFTTMGAARHVFQSEGQRISPPGHATVFQDAKSIELDTNKGVLTLFGDKDVEGPSFDVEVLDAERNAGILGIESHCHDGELEFGLICGNTSDKPLQLFVRCAECGKPALGFHLTPADPVRERNHRWGIVDTDQYAHYVLVDRKRAWNDGDNIVVASHVALDWLDQQPETRIPLVIEMLNVHMTSHRTGIVGGIGSEKHEIAMTALTREKANHTKAEIAKAVKACIALFQRGKKKWPNSKFTLPPEPAATSEEIIAFHEERLPQVSTAVN
jgi:hypothetical protein